ncbi:transglycosylase associated protein [Salmonella enterica subsp. enterica]|uniref:Transglycosylase associated protein n=1 Tax=Salmonella enterica I TaxID=59201 RepID=A0A447PKN7_SALET|nr:transglycosylase associated protein [Salmonella enterica subsp. enterica]
MGIIAWIVFGLIAGVIAKLLMPGRDGGGFILTCILGIVGAVGWRMAGDDVWYWRQYQRL